MKIALIGAGNVGQGLLEILHDQAKTLRSSAGFFPQVVAVATRSRGTLYQSTGLHLAPLLDALRNGTLAGYPDFPGLHRDWDAERIARESDAEVLVEATPSNFTDAQPALGLVEAALHSRKHVVLANKGPVALAYAPLQELARIKGVRLLFEATVMAGTPCIRLAGEALAGANIHAVRGILNGTTNYMLTRMESGMDYAAALAEAQVLGYAETDPTADVDGWDAAGKALILANAIFGMQLSLDAMQVQGIRGISPADIAAAQAAGEHWKLVVQVSPQGASVTPQRLPAGDPLAQVGGSLNAITYHAELPGAITLIGAGAGRRETGFALLSDLLAVHR